MKNTLKKVIATTIVAGSLLTITAFAAIPEFTAVVGSKAIDLNYLNFKAGKDIQDHVLNHIISGQDIYIKTMSGEWVDNLTGDTVSTNKIPEVSYIGPNGEEANYAAGDGDEIGDGFRVISIE